jgi:hypothetical protein
VKHLREFVNKHRAATAVVALAVVALAGWEVYAAIRLGGPVPAPSAVRPASPATAGTGSGGASGAGPAGSAALRAAGHLAGVPAPTLPGASPSTGAAPDGSAPAASAPTTPASAGAAAAGQTVAGGSAAAPAATQPPPGTGRPDPFSPLAASGGGAPAPAAPSLPPVPPLAPGALGPSAFAAPGAATPGVTDPRGQFRLDGIVFGPSAVAILRDGAGSYIVEPGDMVTPGVRILAIDAKNSTVTLGSKDQSWQLGLRGGTSR